MVQMWQVEYCVLDVHSLSHGRRRRRHAALSGQVALGLRGVGQARAFESESTRLVEGGSLTVRHEG